VSWGCVVFDGKGKTFARTGLKVQSWSFVISWKTAENPVMADLSEEIARLQAELNASKAETEAVRTKLHNAVRKGKTIEAERKRRESEIEVLTAQLQELEARLSQRPLPQENGIVKESKTGADVDLTKLRGLYEGAQQEIHLAQEQKAQVDMELQAANSRIVELEQMKLNMQHSMVLEQKSLQHEGQIAAQALKDQLFRAEEENAVLRQGSPACHYAWLVHVAITLFVDCFARVSGYPTEIRSSDNSAGRSV
jgi:chromosome segregation ATPase